MFAPRRGRENDAALPQQGAAGVQGRRCLPCGQRRCRGADSTLFALRAKALQSGAPDHGVSREKAGFRNVFPIRKRSPARRETGERTSLRKGRSFSRAPSPPRSPNEPFPARNGDMPHLTVKTRPSSRKTFRFIRPLQTHPVTSRVSSPPHFRGEHPASPSPASRAFSRLSRHRLIPHYPAGRTAGSARTRSRVQTLENPFLGSGIRSPVAPFPKTPQTASPCSWACRRLCAPPPHSERNAAHPPLLVGRVCVDSEPTALADRTAVTCRRRSWRRWRR